MDYNKVGQLVITACCFVVCSCSPEKVTLTGKYDPNEIVVSGRILLNDLCNKISENGQLVMIRKSLAHDGYIILGEKPETIQLPKPILNLNPNYIVVYRHYIRIELQGGIDRNAGFFIYEKGYSHEIETPSQEILEGIWSYGELKENKVNIRGK